MRMSHTVGAQTTNYAWDVNAGLPVVLQDGTNTYVYGLDLISATDGAGGQTYFTYDGLGSTTDLTNGSATVTGTYSYDVFGTIRSQTGGGANYWQFTGEQTDADSGLQYLRARYYDPATGRFLSTDPIGAAEPYAYVSNNPVNLVDPYGLFGLGDIKDAVSDVADVVEDVAKVAAPVAFQCATWGIVGFGASGGNPVGAAAGCAGGSASYLVGKYIVSNPVSECGIWGVAGFWTFKGSWQGAAGGCAAGALSWFDNRWGFGTNLSQCAAWGGPGAVFASSTGGRLLGAAFGCFGGYVTNAVLNSSAATRDYNHPALGRLPSHRSGNPKE